jgi:phosphatidylethanolamine-binding protein (PEBP) family uncharacterized protein
MFAPAVKTRWDERFLYIESNGLPAHNMMVGITAWQQQVPLPQDYTGANAWRLPLAPVPAKEVRPIKDNFLRGAIAIAANGIPIFNPQNNRGEISLDIGELDEWGGHCGRADDYHYHVAPLHLQKVTGPGHPVAYALDGYPVYGLTEPDGTEPKGLDSLNGHSTPGLGYHYHASSTYPFVMGGFHGEVTEREGQVDPQPRATPVRPALQALRGAKITDFDRDGNSAFKLTYTVAGETRSVGYAVGPDGTCRFEFDHGKDGKLTEVYTRREGRGKAGAPPPGREPRRDGRRDQPAPAARPDQPRSSDGTFLLSSPVVEDNGELPKPFTGEGEGISPPLVWKGAPAGTRCYALLMDHLDPKGEMKWYWTLYDLPGDVSSLKPGSREVGKLGTGFRGKLGYEPPMSKGPGPKTYVITLYALSAPPSPGTPETVNRESLLKAIQGKVLASSSLRVVHTSQGEGGQPPGKRPRPDKGNAKAGPAGLIKPTIGDTMKLNVYADNWFMLYVNDRLVAVDPIEFTPHNVVSVDFLPEYPMNIAVLVKDNANPKNGLEYGSSIGDGGFILKFGDGTVTNATWKAKCFFHGPIDSDTANPRVKTEPLPEKWWSAGFDDSTWPRAKEYTEAEVDPKQPYFESDFKDARFVWTADLALDNTVVFRTRIEKPGWTPRWNTKPDLDVRREHQPSPRNVLSFRKAEGLKLWLACQPLLRRLSAIALATADFRRTPERIELGSQF